jgi:thiol:disulfide interchange protein DsbD
MQSIYEILKSFLETGNLFSSVAAILIAYLGGVLSSFTPCIYPMIPITVGFVGGTAQRNIKNSWILSSIYVLGMAFIYSILGLIASMTGKIFGSMTNTPTWYLALGIIMTLSALWMMEVIQFDPQILFAKFSKKNQSPLQKHENQGKLGAFILGLSSGFIAAPCTTPVLTTILSYIATRGSIVLGTLMMFSFAMGLGTILVIIGTFAGALKILPKSGKWMQTIKIASGILILGLAEYFIYKAGKL